MCERRWAGRALPERGKERSVALPSEHRLHLRPGRNGGRYILHRYGVRAGRYTQRLHLTERVSFSRYGRSGDYPGSRSSRRSAPQRRDPPGHKASEHPDNRLGRREGRRLRHRPGRLVEHGDRDRLDYGHGPLRFSRAGGGRAGEPPKRSVLLGRRSLRDAHRRVTLRRGEPHRHRDAACGRPPAPAAGGGPLDPGGHKRCSGAATRQRSEGPAPGRRQPLGGSGPRKGGSEAVSSDDANVSQGGHAAPEYGRAYLHSEDPHRGSATTTPSESEAATENLPLDRSNRYPRGLGPGRNGGLELLAEPSGVDQPTRPRSTGPDPSAGRYGPEPRRSLRDVTGRGVDRRSRASHGG